MILIKLISDIISLGDDDMKKKIIICLLVLTCLFTLTACGSKSEASTDSNSGYATLVDLKYKEPKEKYKMSNYNIDENSISRSYDSEEDENKSIRLYYLKGKDYTYVEDEYTKYTTKEINGTTWRIIHETFSGFEYDTYYVIHDGALYQIELNVTEKYQQEFDEFMNTVSFK